MSELAIRLASPEDAPMVANILTEAAEWMEARGIRDCWANPYPLELAADHVGEGIVYLAFEAEQPVATLSLQTEDIRFWGIRPPDALYLHRLALRSEYHGQAIGVDLIVWAKDQVRQVGRHYLRLDCNDHNEKLKAYYEEQGFRYKGYMFGRQGYRGALYEVAIETEQRLLT